jgi:hypothetical protein
MPGFFPRVQSSLVNDVVKTRVIVDVGGNGDCGFRAIAAGIMDNFLSFPEKNERLLSIVLSSHFNYFPRHRPPFMNGAKKTTAEDWMHYILSQFSKVELIQTLAFTLRQIAVNEIIEVSADPKNPNNDDYIGALIQDNEHTSPKKMREPKTWIDETSMKALSNRLGLPITVEVKVPGKALRMSPRKYNPSLNQPEVVIQLHAGHYQPKLLKSNQFTSNTYTVDVSPKPVIRDAVLDCDMDDILKVVQASEARIIAKFDEIYTGLINMLAAGELDKEKLLRLYIKGMNTSDYLTGRVRHADLENGTDHFSRAIKKAQGLPDQPTDQAHDDYVVTELMHALAREWSLCNNLSAEDVFSQIYAQTNSSLVL